MVGKLFAKTYNGKIGSQNNSFTLIELLVVIAIIGLLSSVVLASLNSARAKSRNAKRVEMVKQYQNALELYHTDKGSYPISGNTAKCLGLSDSETCIKLYPYTGSSGLKAALESYISGVPPLNEPVNFNGLDMSGLAYKSITGASYELYWVGEGVEPFCGGGNSEISYGVIAKVCKLTF